jgi:predicted dehydrogenase
VERFTRAEQAGSPTADIRVGLVGLGYWGPNLLRVLADTNRVEVRWICDLDEDRLERLGHRYPAISATRQFSDLLDDDALDAVVVATPVFTHADLAMRALLAGKHVFVEKPLAASLEEARGLNRLAADSDLALMCGQTFVFSPPVRAIKQLIENGELGEIFFISSSRVNLGLHQQDVSVIWDLGPHDFSIILYWLDELPATISAVGRDSIVPGIPDVAFVRMAFPSGVLANVELSWLAPSKLRRTVLVGSEKMVVYQDGSPEPVRLFDHGVVYQDPKTFGEYHLSYRTGDIVSPRVDNSEPLALELAQFLSCVRERVVPERHTWLAEQVVALAEAAQASLTDGGGQIELARTQPDFAETERVLD